MVKKYLDHHNIEFIISGHQDTVSFSIMPNLDYILNPDHIKHTTGVNYLKEFPIDKLDESQKLHFNDNWQFLITHNFGNYNDLNKDEYNFKLTRDDFIAIVLSTAVTYYKFNNYHSYINLKLE